MATRRTPTAAMVDAYIAGLSESLKAAVEALRRVILSADAGIGEAVKWNAPSFHTGEHFATLRINGQGALQLILHLGPRKRVLPRDAIDDPTGLLRWLGPDRACVGFTGAGDVAARADALRAVLRQWMRHVPARRDA